MDERTLRERAEIHEANVARFEKELAEVMKQIALLEKQMQAVREDMLEP